MEQEAPKKPVSAAFKIISVGAFLAYLTLNYLIGSHSLDIPALIGHTIRCGYPLGRPRFHCQSGQNEADLSIAEVFEVVDAISRPAQVLSLGNPQWIRNHPCSSTGNGTPG